MGKGFISALAVGVVALGALAGATEPMSATTMPCDTAKRIGPWNAGGRRHRM